MTHHPTSHADLPSLLELAEVVATCIPFLPPAGQQNIGRVVEQMALIAQAGPEWMPIDSAPRDGTRILIYAPDETDPDTVVAYYAHPDWTCGRYGYRPSHWLPLPPRPKESE